MNLAPKVTSRSAALLLLAGAVRSLCAACSTTPPPASAHNLERPSDMTFACVGLFGVLSADGGTSTADGGVTTPTVSGRPMSWCHAPGKFDLPFDLEHRTFAFVSNTARHELSLVDMDNSKLIDLDPSNPETNVAPLGVLPEQISASDDGCRIVSANRGSCDLSMVDVGKLATPALNAEGSQSTAESARSTVSQDIVVQGSSGKRLYVAPQEVLFLPQDSSALTGTQNLCGDIPHADPVGWNATPATPLQTQWKALVSYPSCDLVALVDLPTGLIVDSVKITPRAGGGIDVMEAGSDPDCPQHDFCDATTAPGGGASDAGGAPGADGGAASTGVAGELFVNPTGTRPGPMAILPNGRRAYIGLTQASFVVAIDIQPDRLTVPISGPSITLHEGALGAQRLRLSVDPYKRTGEPGQFGRFVGEGSDRSRQYLYVVANDSTVRVVDVSLGMQNLPEVECDTNLDPVYVRAHLGDSTDDGASIATCPPAAPPDFAHRRPLTQGPGIRLPAIPRDVSFVDFKLGNPLESVLDGAFAFILTSSGAVYIVNIDGTPRTQTLVSGTTTGTTPLPAPVPEEPPLVNSLRDHNALTFLATMDPSLGPPRVDLAPAAPAEGPQIEPITTSDPHDNPTQTTTTPVLSYIFFPQRTAVNRQTWTVSWQGDFFGPSFSGQFSYDRNLQHLTAIQDVSADFCQAGAVPGDVVTIFGCTNDLQCGPLQVCRRSDTSAETVGTLPINGLCVPADPTLQAAKLKTCAPLLDTVRRYEVVGATRSTLAIRPKLDEVVTTVFNGCVPSGAAGADGGAPAGTLEDGGASTDGGTRVGCGPASDPTRGKFVCAEVDPGAGPRCVQPCTLSAECRPGRVCVAYGAARYCADGPDPSQPPEDGSGATLLNACGLDQLTAYKVGVGSGFLVQGTAPTPYVPPVVDAGGGCQVNPDRLNRISYVQTAADGTRTLIPMCSDLPPITLPTADAGAADSGAPESSVQDQLLAIAHTAPNPTPCLIGTLTDGKLGPPYRVLFQNREIRFILADAEEYFSDTVYIAFDVHGGFLADTVFIPGTIDVEMPTRIVTSPIDSQGQLFDGSETTEIPYLYVVDQRRLGRASAGVGATRGQVLRIHPRRSYTTDVNALLPIYEDYTLSGNLWPIQ